MFTQTDYLNLAPSLGRSDDEALYSLVNRGWVLLLDGDDHRRIAFDTESAKHYCQQNRSVDVYAMSEQDALLVRSGEVSPLDVRNASMIGASRKNGTEIDGLILSELILK